MLTVTFFLIFDSTAIKALKGFGNYTIHCALGTDQGTLNSISDSKWIAIAQLLDTISQAILCKSAIEFLASQTPYSMRGLMLAWCWLWKYTIFLPFGKFIVLARYSSVINLGYRNHQLWILVPIFTAAWFDHYQWTTPCCWKVVQEQKERRRTAKWIHLCWEILFLYNYYE